jgi:hypothetical protein
MLALSGRCRLDPALQALGTEGYERLIVPFAGRLADTVARDGHHAEALRQVAECLIALEQALGPTKRRWWQR